LFIYFTYVLAYIQVRTESIINKQGYGSDRKGTWKRGICFSAEARIVLNFINELRVLIKLFL